MIESILRNDYTGYYGLPVSTTLGLSQNTSAMYFEIEDSEGAHVVHLSEGNGMAAFQISMVMKYLSLIMTNS